MSYIPDVLDLWAEQQAKKDRELEHLPRCAICDEPIQGEYLYEINDETICKACLVREYRKSTEDYME